MMVWFCVLDDDAVPHGDDRARLICRLDRAVLRAVGGLLSTAASFARRFSVGPN